MSFKLSDFNEKSQQQIRSQLADNLRRLEAKKSEQASSQALDRCLSQLESCKGCLVSLISVVRRPFDDDNSVASLKPLRDAIATSLGIDDGDKRIKFQYQQIKTKGREGVIVRIETL